MPGDADYAADYYASGSAATEPDNLASLLAGGKLQVFQKLGYTGPVFEGGPVSVGAQEQGQIGTVSPQFTAWLEQTGNKIVPRYEGSNLVVSVVGPDGKELGAERFDTQDVAFRNAAFAFMGAMAAAGIVGAGVASAAGGEAAGSVASGATNPALIESAVGTPGYGASSAGSGGMLGSGGFTGAGMGDIADPDILGAIEGGDATAGGATAAEGGGAAADLGLSAGEYGTTIPNVAGELAGAGGGLLTNAVGGGAADALTSALGGWDWYKSLGTGLDVAGKMFSNPLFSTLVGAGVQQWSVEKAARENREFAAQEAANKRRRQAPVGMLGAKIDVLKGAQGG